MELARKKRTKTASAPARGKASRKSLGPASNKGSRFVLIVGDEGAILIFMQGVKVVRRLFAPSVQVVHTEAMREIMRSHPRVPVYLLADVLDQQYIPHSFPPVSALSVGGLVKRRLERDFQTDDLKAALPLGRDKTGRKEWKFLLIALAKTSLISEWIDLLVQLPNDMRGVYLTPVEAVNYLNLLNRRLGHEKARPWQLLISYNKVSGFRQVVMREDKLVFTRVSQAMDDAIPAVIAGNVEQEIINTIEYLKRLQFKNNNELDVTIVISPDVSESIDLSRFEFGSTVTLSPLQVADALGLEQAALSADRFGDVVMAAAFGIAKKPALRFSTAYIDKLEKLYKTGTAIRAGAAVLAVVLLGLAAVAGASMWGDYSAANDARAKIEQLQPQLLRAKTAVDGLNKDVAFKSAIVASYDAYVKAAPLPADFAKDLMPFISPQARLMSLNWTYENGLNAPATAPRPADALPLMVKTEFDLSGSGADVDALNLTAKNLIDRLKTNLPQYDITVEPFPWLKEEPRQEEITRDVTQAITVSAQNMIIVITFRGVKPVAKNTAAAAVPNEGQMPQ